MCVCSLHPDYPVLTDPFVLAIRTHSHPIQRIYTTYDEQGSPGDGGEEQGEREGDGGQMEESGPKALVV